MICAVGPRKGFEVKVTVRRVSGRENHVEQPLLDPGAIYASANVQECCRQQYVVSRDADTARLFTTDEEARRVSGRGL